MAVKPVLSTSQLLGKALFNVGNIFNLTCNGIQYKMEVITGHDIILEPIPIFEERKPKSPLELMNEFEGYEWTVDLISH